MSSITKFYIMKKYFSTEVLFVLMLVVSFNSILLAQNVFQPQSKFAKIDVGEIYGKLSYLRGTDKSGVIKLPVVDFKEMDFIVKENNTITGDFKKEYPDILSFDIISKTDPTYRGALTVSKSGLYASILTDSGLLGIWPSNSGKRNLYKVYLGNNDPENVIRPLTCREGELEQNIRRLDKEVKIESRSTGSNGEKLRTYRLVIVSTGEFYEANGKNKNKVNSLIVAVVNGWNVILKNDIAVRLNIAKSPYIYTNKNTDPFIPNGSGGKSRTTQAVNAIHSRFPNKNSYDIGHVMHNHSSALDPDVLWDNGGLAGLGVVCDNSTYFGTTGGPNKAAGWSGAYHNDDNGYIQLSVHEVGHQFNMTHTFNGTGGACTDNISDNTAYEIGSGTTIMSYSSSCEDSQNIPEGGVADNYYHSNSVERAIDFIRNEATCASVSNTGNTPPEVDAGAHYVIPRNTPFVLTGVASDADDDKITYCWEQYDEDGPGTPAQGYIGSAAASNRKAPLFRSYPPTEVPWRYFPNMKYILEGRNRNLPFEALPSVNRVMHFRLLVRDNNLSGGGVAWDETSITVDNKATLFQVNSQNSSTTYNADGVNKFEVKWNVGGTDKAPISCTEVEIYFSDDGGKSFPYLLATTANDGSEELVVPNLPTIEGRVMVKAKGNIFFDVNNKDIKITSSCAAIGTTFLPDEDVIGDDSGEIDENLNLNLKPVYGKKITKFNGSIRSNDIASKLVFKKGGSCGTAGNDVKYDLHEFYVTKSGNYKFKYSGVYGLVMNLYISSYDESNKCDNWITSSGVLSGNSVLLNNYFSANLKAGKKYIIRISSFSSDTPSLPANYSISAVTKPTGALLYDNIVPPGDDYSYTFIATDNESGIIGAISSESDFRFLNAGIYTVRGASVANSDTTLFLSYEGQKMSDLFSSVIASEICANFSANTIQLTVFGAACPISDEGLTDLLCNDNGTNMNPDDDYITFTLNPVGFEDTSVYHINIADGLTLIPDSASFGKPTDFILKGVKGVDDIPFEISYGEDCHFSFMLPNPGTCSDCENADARINEFHYDNEKADEGEFVEVYVINPQPDSLNHYIVTLYNGSNGKKYASESLDNMEVTQGNNGSFYVWTPASIQNGSPDGISLTGECNVLEFISYEGSFTAVNGDAAGMTSVDIGVDEPKNTPKGSSLQFIEGTWVKTIGFNTKGAVNDLGPCLIVGAEIVDVTCFDNNTSYDPVDDVVKFDLKPVGNQLTGEYTIESAVGSISPGVADFDSLTSFVLEDHVAGTGDVEITIKSKADADCSYTFTLTDPGSCSPDCLINEAGLSAVACDNNNTPNYAGDDFITFDLNPVSYNTSSEYLVKASGGAISPEKADFGSASSFATWKGSAGKGDIILSITDKDNDTCAFEVIIVDPGVCSTDAVENMDNKEKNISLYPNPAGDYLYFKTDMRNIKTVKIVNGLGKQVYNNNYKTKVNISKLVDGSYFILFYNDKDILIETHKFLKY